MKKISLIRRYFSKISHFLIREYVFLPVSLISLILISFSKIFTNPYAFFSADVSEQYFPWWVYFNNKFHEFVLPIRNEFYLSGSTPFAARGETTILYPVYLFFHLLYRVSDNLDTAFLIFFTQQLTNYLLGGFFFYLLLKVGLRLNKWASFIASVTYVFSGSFMARLVHPPYQNTLVWYPLLFLFYLLFLREKKLIYALIDSIILAVLIFSGHPQIIYYFLIFFILSILFLTLTEKKQRCKLLVISILTVLSGLLIASIQLIPTFEMSLNISRIVQETTVKNLYNSLHPLYYLSLFAPKLFGQHRQGYWGSEYPWGNWDSYLYIGIIPLLFIFFSVWWKNKRFLFIFNFSLLLTILVSFGRYSGISTFINRNLPFSDSITFVSRITLVFHFYITVLVGIGAEVLFTYRMNKRKIRMFAISVSGIILTILFLRYSPFLMYNYQLGIKTPPSFELFLSGLMTFDRSLQLIVLSSFLITFYMIFRKKILIYLMIMTLLADILPLNQQFNPIEPAISKPSTYFGETQQVRLIKEDKSVFRVLGLIPRNIGLVQSIETVGGYSTITSKAYQDIIPYLNMRYPNVLSMANVKYINGAKNLSSENFEKLGFNLLENKKVLPRVFFVKGYQYVNNEVEMIKKLTANNFNPQEYVFFLKDAQVPHFEYKNNSFLDADHPAVQILGYKQDMIDVSVTSDNDGFLFLSELQYPGWGAYIDGKKSKLLNANNSFYALPIQKGYHKVSFRFISSSFIIGIIISVFTLGLLCFLIINSKFRNFLLRKR